MPVAQRDAGAFLPDTLLKYGLSKESLVRRGWEFERIYSQGKRLHGKGFTLICHAHADNNSRLGISVHGKIRGAVKRNRIKRIIRESFRLHREIYPANVDIVFAVRPDFDLLSPLAVIQAVAFVARRDATP